MAHVPRGMCSRRSTCAPPSVVCSTVTTPPQRSTSSHEHRRPAGARLSTPRAASRGPRGALCRAPCPSTGCDRHQREDARCRPPAPREARGCRVSVGRWREARGRGSSRKLRAASGRRGVNWGRTRRELRCCWLHHGARVSPRGRGCCCCQQRPDWYSIGGRLPGSPPPSRVAGLCRRPSLRPHSGAVPNPVLGTRRPCCVELLV